MSTTYIETYIFGFGGVTNKRNFSGENNSAGVTTTYGNINSAKTDRDNRRQDRVRKEIDGGETVDGSTKYYTTQSALDADTSFTGTKLLTNESFHFSGRDLETNTTEVARQTARVAERGTYNASNDTYAGDTGTEKEREDARTLESGTTEVARQAARVAESGTYDATTDTYDSTSPCKEKDRQDYRNRENLDDELTPWDPDNATNANYRTYINFPGNIA